MKKEKDLKKYLNAYREANFSWELAQTFLQQPDDLDWVWFFDKIMEIHWKKKDKSKGHTSRKKVHTYTPGTSFPSISVTGSDCELHCAHCNKKYLHHMKDAKTPNNFKEVLKSLKQNNCEGALISGGCTSEGKVPLLQYKKIIKKFKERNPDIYLNSHVGLLNKQEISELEESMIDMVSFDLILAEKVIRRIFHLPYSPQTYKETFENLLQTNLRIAPHILIGAYFGEIREELKIIKYLYELMNSRDFSGTQFKKPSLLVFIAMIPPRKTAKQETNKEIDKQGNENGEPRKKEIKFHKLTAIEIAKVMFLAKVFLPSLEMSLGCMRPKFSRKERELLERFAIQIGIDRIEIPSRRTIQWLEKKGFSIITHRACCAIPYSED